MHCWAEALEGWVDALAFRLDIAKAYERICHEVLLSKLPSYVIPERVAESQMQIHRNLFRGSKYPSLARQLYL